MRSNKDLRYWAKVNDVVYLNKDVKSHIGRKMMIPKNVPCKVISCNYDSVTLRVLAGPTVGEKHTIRSNHSRAEETIFLFTGKVAELIYG